MKKNELRVLQSRYEPTRQSMQSEFERREKLRRQFVTHYTQAKILNLKKTQYVVGKQGYTFCNRLERELDCLGRITGSPSPKFGAWYGHRGKDSEIGYKFTKTFGGSLQEAFSNVKQEIAALIRAGRDDDFTRIKKSKLCNLVRGKILSVYFPDKYLNIFVDDHLDHFRSHLDLSATVNHVIDKQMDLMAFKNSDAIMKEWSTLEFDNFLYSSFGPPDYENPFGRTKTSRSKQSGDFPPLDQVCWTVLNKGLKKIPPKTKPATKRTGKVKGGKEAANKRLGDRGEMIALLAEHERVGDLGFSISKVKHTAEKNDYAGYDIKSIGDDGKTSRYIEVKSTRSAPGAGQFLISSNEMEQAQKLDNYCIYLVFKAHSSQPKVIMLERPFDKKNKAKLNIAPSQYRVGYKVN